ncbi:beta-glucosidase BglX [Mycoplasmatota bacterium]|nr:beta-glucosidase BglX [Mycoplasmatota bacterium]
MRSIKRDPLPKRTNEEINQLVNDLMSKMTLKEKIGQLYQTTHDGAAITGPSYDASQNKKLINEGLIGSFLGLYDNMEIYRLQKEAVENTRLGIPLFFANDIIHGCRTSFPHNLAMACSWDPKLIEEASSVAAYESSHSGINMTFSPMLDIVRDPRWGRVMESFGEDPYLGQLYARAYVDGYQQDDLTSYDSVGACAKHFVGYGQIEGGRDYNTVDMSERVLRQFYLPPFEAAVDAGCEAVMSSFNVYDSVPATANKFLLRTVLKEGMNFSGFIISDYTSSGEIINHKIASDMKEVAKKCIEAGLDHEMVSNSYINHLETLVNEGSISESLIDDSCRRMLTFKYKIGLFDNPYKNIYLNFEDYWLKDEDRQKAKEVALNSVVLLKNEKVLPLKTKKIALIGPLAKSNQVIGPWCGKARDEDCVSLYDGLKRKFGDAIEINYSLGVDYNSHDESLFNEAIEAAKLSDVIVLAMGEQQWMSGEAQSRASIEVPGGQLKLLKELRKLGKEIVFVLFTGRPLDLREVEKNSDAIVCAWFLGNESGNALADILYGDYNPSGKLTMSFPYVVGQIPIYYNHLNTGRPYVPEDFYRSKYSDIPNNPLYPFGYGLSYTEFSYTNISFNQEEDEVSVHFTITNEGDFDGVDIPQVYIEAKSFSVSRPVNELKGFKKVFLKAGESKEIIIKVKKKEFAYYNIEMKKAVESGEYLVKLARNAEDIVSTKTISFREEIK